MPAMYLGEGQVLRRRDGRGKRFPNFDSGEIVEDRR